MAPDRNPTVGRHRLSEHRHCPPQQHLWRSGFTWGRSPNRGAWTLLTIYADTCFFISLYVKPDGFVRTLRYAELLAIRMV